MSELLTVEQMLKERGKRSESVLVAGDLVSHKAEIPIVVNRGTKLHPILSITAGMHATEYAAIMAAHKLARSIDPDNLEGTLIVAPLVNRYGFDEFSRRENPVDHTNLNRIFPGDSDGSVSYQMAAVLFKEVISRADCYIDLHGGEIGESLSPFIVSPRTGNEKIDTSTASLMSAFGFDHVWQFSCLADAKSSAEESQSGFAITRAALAGIPAFIAEGGGEGKLKAESVRLLYDGVLSVMRKMGMTKGKPKTTELVFSYEAGYLLAKKSGMLQLGVGAGEEVRSRQKLGEIVSLDSGVLETVRAPFDAIVVSVRTFALVKKTDLLFLVLRL